MRRVIDRAAFPVLARSAYLNAGTCGPVPAAAEQAAAEAWSSMAREGRGGASFFDRWASARQALREAYAEVLGAPATNVALTTSTSEGVVRALRGAGLRHGDEVLTADDEHPGLTGPLATLREALGIRVREVPLERLAEGISEETRVVACSHVSWYTGRIAPLEALRARPDSVRLLLDGAQGVGALDFAVGDLGCDWYAGSGQKWLCGPIGLGMLWSREPLGLEPIGMTYMSFEDPAAVVPWADARRHDTFSLDLATLAPALAALEVLGPVGERAPRALELADRLARELGDRVVPRDATTLVTWEVDGDPEAVRDRLAEAGVVVRNLPGRPWVRASVGAWNDESDLDRLLAALP